MRAAASSGHLLFPSLCRRCSGPTVLSGSPLPSASAVSCSLCSVSLKPKERLWSKSQPILWGDDSPFPGVAALLAGTVWVSEGTEACL